ncbi:nitroreductase [Streptomyces sp. GQFP]|uniref:nitroreductase n=1 Tax=Streptomyces sp. GQFP TaxID=2907545 RepID=UPI001F347E43|nr:nitroreductase [Streptomyces sp. GQFP]UIX31978.1 nitroreductase [Streptomyces sp. GQFP]
MSAEDRAASLLVGLLDARHSVRAFREDQVPHATIVRMLEMAQLTPSWCNTQPWHATVTSGAGTERFRAALHAHARDHKPAPDFEFPAGYVGDYRRRRKDAGVALYQALGIGREDRQASAAQALENFRLFGAPHVAILTTEADLGVYGVLDCGLWLQSFLLAGASLGVACTPQAALASTAPFVREFFDIPETRRIVCGVSFGYEDTTHPANSFRTGRDPLDVTWLDA